MQYGQVIRGRFLTRPNRFIAHVALPGGETVVCHVKNRDTSTSTSTIVYFWTKSVTDFLPNAGADLLLEASNVTSFFISGVSFLVIG